MNIKLSCTSRGMDVTRKRKPKKSRLTSHEVRQQVLLDTKLEFQSISRGLFASTCSVSHQQAIPILRMLAALEPQTNWMSRLILGSSGAARGSHRTWARTVSSGHKPRAPGRLCTFALCTRLTISRDVMRVDNHKSCSIARSLPLALNGAATH